jgi:hypothetical protein
VTDESRKPAQRTPGGMPGHVPAEQSVIFSGIRTITRIVEQTTMTWPRQPDSNCILSFIGITSFQCIYAFAHFGSRKCASARRRHEQR